MLARLGNEKGQEMDTENTEIELAEQDTETTQEAVEAEAVPEKASVVPKPKVLAIPVNKMASIKAAERERGKAEALAAMDQHAQELGYASWQEFTEERAVARAAESSSSTGQSEKRASPKTSVKPAASETAGSADGSDASVLYKRANLARAEAVRENRKLKQQLEAVKAETSLRVAAVQSGVVDADYALVVLRRHLAGKTQTELSKFDAARFFGGDLKRTHPYLYKAAEELPTTSSEDAATEVDAKAVSKVAPKAAPKPVAGKAIDAMKMTRQEYSDYLRNKGLSSPDVGGPS
jgi:hypothetical protein